MASRDLTLTYIERRNAALKRRSNSLGNGGLGGGKASSSSNGAGSGSKSPRLTAGGLDNHSLMLMEEGEGIQLTNMGLSAAPIWVKDVDQVKSILHDIQRNMDTLQKMHASRVGSVFGKDLDDMEVQIEAMTRDITASFRTAEQHLKVVGQATRRAGGEEAAIGANIQRSLAKQLQELSVDFRQSQRKYLAEVQAQKSGVSGGLNDKFAGIDLSTGMDGGGGDFFTTQQVQVVDDLQDAIQSRDQEISKIAQSIEELGTIFKELAVLVIDQGTILDRIDYNMEAVVEHTKTGIQQLERAEKAQKNARPMKCIMCLVTTIFVLLVLLVLKHKKW
mmetsp:Transcript_61315/g.150077  ORF Transcript_61315/g.150077 Transcript_61315/m.150077 type:complete len:333 (-) Transcript_61315:42-1040(-)